MRNELQKHYSLNLVPASEIQTKILKPIPEECCEQSFVRNGTKAKTPLKQLVKIHLEFVRFGFISLPSYFPRVTSAEEPAEEETAKRVEGVGKDRR